MAGDTFRYNDIEEIVRVEFPKSTEGVTLDIAGVLAQSGGFFLHLGVGQDSTPSAGTKLTRVGAVLIGASLVALAVGLIQTA